MTEQQPLTGSTPPVDLTEMKKTVRGNMEVIRHLVDHILVEYPEKLRQLRQELDKGDVVQVRAIAHGLKSSLASFGATQAKEFASALEISGAMGELAAAEKMLRRLEQEIERIVAYFSDPCWQDKG
ncbi:MAG: Hpt domain-containing protein [Desulfobulbaceae bacterium]|nr:Hpt domain-containing protein [Desulfobulbaceae bacterium]HIJ89992.1 Hpt domain-containing protein [Deltaproteobacteria bacterium]